MTYEKRSPKKLWESWRVEIWETGGDLPGTITGPRVKFSGFGDTPEEAAKMLKDRIEEEKTYLMENY